jgi:hypothetical protein
MTTRETESLRLLRDIAAPLWPYLTAAQRARMAALLSAEMSDDARDAMSLPPRDRGRRIGVQVGRWFVGVTR